MSSLLIGVISIALIAAVTVATVMYISNSIMDGQAKVAATKHLNAGETIRGTAHMYKAQKGAAPETIQDLVDSEYLSTIPEGEWSLVGGNVIRSDLNEATCKRVNMNLHGTEDILLCDDMVVGMAGCCSAAPVAPEAP